MKAANIHSTRENTSVSYRRARETTDRRRVLAALDLCLAELTHRSLNVRGRGLGGAGGPREHGDSNLRARAELALGPQDCEIQGLSLRTELGQQSLTFRLAMKGDAADERGPVRGFA